MLEFLQYIDQNSLVTAELKCCLISWLEVYVLPTGTIIIFHLLQACVKRVEGDDSGHKHCTGQYFDYWFCIDKCVSFSFHFLMLS